MGAQRGPRAATVLIAQDRVEDQQVLRAELEGMGYAVIEASNCQHALAEARRARPDIILSGMQVCGANGFELCRQLQQDADLRHVPVVFVTAASSVRQVGQFAQDAGAVGSQLLEKVAEQEQLARLYKMLSQTNKAIVRISSREQLFQTICRIAVEQGGLRLARIVLIDQADGHPRPAAWYGEAAGFAEDPRTSLDGLDAKVRILTGEALSLVTPVINNDLSNNPTAIASHGPARCAGVGALAVYPLSESGVVVGALELYACQPGFFTTGMLATLEEVADDISFALGNYAHEAERTRASQAAAAAVDYNRLLIASSPVGIITYKGTGAAVSANEAAAKLVGGTVEQLGAQNFRKLESWSESGLLSLAEEALATNRAIAGDVHITSSTFGKEICVAVRLVPFEHESERHLLALLSDITDRVRAEQELRDKDRRLSEAQRLANLGSWQFDLKSRLLSWSDETYRIYGVSAATFTPTLESLANLIHPEDRAAMQAWSAACEAGQRPGELQFRIIRPDGTVRIINSRGELMYDTENRPTRMMGMAQDITERKRAHQALAEAEGKYRALVEQQTLVGIFMIDEGRVLYHNPRADEIFGYEPGELVGRSLKSLTMDADWPAAERAVRGILSGEVPTLKMEFRGLRKDGREAIISAQGSAVRSGGRPIIVGMMQDVTEQRRSEQQNRSYLAQLETAFMHTVEVATTLSEMRDPYTAGHERRVAEIAVAIGAELGFDAGRQQGLRVAGFLHDIGKIMIPAEILSKPGKLTATEFALVKGHSQASYDVLKRVDFPWPVARVALQHHERIDGSGYPLGLKGEAILLDARVLAVADVIEAMASHRPYRPGLGIDMALAEIERGRGSAYDSVVVDACLKLFREKVYQLPQV
jgi:PAS domain S-box-containing protein